MQFQIEVINVQATTKPTAKSSYVMLDVAFKRLDTGKIEGKKIMSFTFKDVYSALAGATNGSQFTITTEKNEKTTYWDWTMATPLTGGTTASATPAATPSAGFTSPKSTYETADERAIKQVLIVRQSSLSNAITALADAKKPPTIDDILRTADIFSNWVYQKGQAFDKKEEFDLSEMDNDIPM